MDVDENLDINLDDVNINFFGSSLHANNGLGIGDNRLLRIIQRIKPSTNVYAVQGGPRNFSKIISSVRRERHSINIWAINIESFAPYMKGISVVPGYNIARWHWELPYIPAKWQRNPIVLDEIWTISSFAAASMRTATHKPVTVIPHDIELTVKNHVSRRDFSLPEGAFLFLFAYDFLSTRGRKNPDAVIDAFKHAFSPHDHNVGLVIKIRNCRKMSEYNQLRSKCARYSNIYFVKGDLDRTETIDLFNMTDCFVSLHRAEGFGMCLAEAMYLNKPVIGTGWSGNMDFMDRSNSCVVRYDLVKNNKQEAVYEKGCSWANPDIGDAARYMKELRENINFRTDLAANGQRTILDLFSSDRVERLVRQRLQEIIKSRSFSEPKEVVEYQAPHERERRRSIVREEGNKLLSRNERRYKKRSTS